MKAVFWISVFLACVIIAWSEFCTTKDDCQGTLCGANNQDIACKHETNVPEECKGRCTCEGITCKNRTECINHGSFSCTGGSDFYQCIDSFCTCQYLPPTGRRQNHACPQ